MKLILAITFFALNAHAAQEATLDGKEAHGGNTVVCRDSHHRIKSVKLMDFYEGENLYGVRPKVSNEPYYRQALAIADKLDAVIYEGGGEIQIHRRIFNEAIRHITIMEPDVGLKPVDDSKDILIPGNCTVEQTALFTPDGLIHIVSNLWNRMSETDRAGLVVHEALFRMERQAGQTDSIRARKINAYAFAGFDFESAVPPLAGESYFCTGSSENGRISFMAEVSEDKFVNIYYTYLPKRGYVYSRRSTAKPYPIQIFPFAKGRADQTVPPSFKSSCDMVGLNSKFENYDEITQCIYNEIEAGVIQTSFAVKISEQDDPSSLIKVPYVCEVGR